MPFRVEMGKRVNSLLPPVAVYLTRAAERRRRGRLAAGVVTVFINTNRFSNEPQYGNSATYESAMRRMSVHAVMKAVDEINRRHGHDTVRFGVAQPKGRWQTKGLKQS